MTRTARRTWSGVLSCAPGALSGREPSKSLPAAGGRRRRTSPQRLPHDHGAAALGRGVYARRGDRRRRGGTKARAGAGQGRGDPSPQARKRSRRGARAPSLDRPTLLRRALPALWREPVRGGPPRALRRDGAPLRRVRRDGARAAIAVGARIPAAEDPPAPETERGRRHPGRRPRPPHHSCYSPRRLASISPASASMRSSLTGAPAFFSPASPVR